jgi:hypothetical protein
MFTERDVLVAQQRRRDMMNAAQQARLSRAASSAKGARYRVYERWMAQLGTWLVDQGERLQARHTHTSITPSIASK